MPQNLYTAYKHKSVWTKYKIKGKYAHMNLWAQVYMHTCFVKSEVNSHKEIQYKVMQ